MTTDYKKGIRKTGAMVSMVNPGAVVTPINLYLLTAGRTCKLRLLHIFNRNGGNTVVQVGTGLAGLYAQAIPGYFVATGQHLVVGEGELEGIIGNEFTATITIQATVAAAAPLDVQAIADVEEFQGPTG